MRGHGAAGLGDDVRVRQLVFLADLPQRAHDGVGVLLHRVVGGAGAARAGAFVVHAQAAAHVHDADADAEFRQFREAAARLLHAALHVADVGDLRTQVEVQELQ